MLQSRVTDSTARHRPDPGHRLRTALVPVVALVILSALAGCAVLDNVGYAWGLLRANRAGARFYRNYEHLERDVVYAEWSDARLDVYSPPEGEGHPVVIFVHGGSWDSLDKELFAPVAMQLLPRDLVVVIPGYTLYPDATYEQMTREIAAAVDWTLDNVADYGGDPGRVLLSGHSAGGHLSGLVAFDGRWLAELDRSPDEIAGWFGMSGVYDVAAQVAWRAEQGLESPQTIAAMGGEENLDAASPVRYVAGGRYASPLPSAARRAWVMHGTADETVPLFISERMAEAIESAGIPTTRLFYEGAGHSDFLLDALDTPDARILVDVTAAARSLP